MIMLIMPNIDSRTSKDKIISKLNDLKKENPKPVKITINIYNLSVPIEYEKISNLTAFFS